LGQAVRVSEASVAEAQGDGGSGERAAETDARRVAMDAAESSDGDQPDGVRTVSFRGDAKTALSCALSPACRQAYKEALEVDMSTPEGKAAFWSGGKNAKNAARAWAVANGGYTDEMQLNSTDTGRSLLAALKGDQLTDGQKGALWRIVSAKFAMGANGEVNVFLTTLTNKSAIYFQVEEPILMTKESFGLARIEEHYVLVDPTRI
jgi:hypothetical protein